MTERERARAARRARHILSAFEQNPTTSMQALGTARDLFNQVRSAADPQSAAALRAIESMARHAGIEVAA